MTINQVNSPSFGRLYQTATSRMAREKLLPFHDIVSSQKNLINDLDQKDYDVLVSFRDDARWDTNVPFAITIEVCEKFKQAFDRNFTPLLKLNNDYSATRTIVLDKDIKKNILKFLDEIRAVISKE